MSKFFSPIQLGNLTLRNRLVMPPMGTGLATSEGFVTQRLIDYLEERAKGGVGLIITENASFDIPRGRMLPHSLRIDSDEHIKGLSELVKAIHRYDTKIALPIAHGGQMVKSSVSGMPPVAASPIAAPGGELPRELSVDEINEITSLWARAAVRAKQAGLDAVDIHAAHSFLLVTFLSPATNKRKDQYGGDLAGRARFLLEVVRAIRELVGPDYPIMCRINGQEYGLEGGITIQETKQVAKWLEEAGVQAIDLSAFGWGHPILRGSTPRKPGFLLPLAMEVKNSVNIPVIAVGRIDAQLAEKAIEEGKADLIAVGRGLFVDPYFMEKAAAGRFEDIRPCTGCVRCRDGLLHARDGLSHGWSGVRCEVNPALGREKEMEIIPAPSTKKVVVIGGGPAGMEAARVAAQRGHKVVLYEKERVLGGQLLVASIPPEKEDLEPFRRFLEAQVRKSGVHIELGKVATPDSLANEKPEAIIAAIGSEPYVPDIEGIDNKRVVLAMDVLAGKASVGDVAAIIGGELVGCELADFLAQKGKKITICRRRSEIATGVNPTPRRFLLQRLAQNKVRVLTGVKYEAIDDKGLNLINDKGDRETIEADTIILAAGSRPNSEVIESFKGLTAELVTIGDCVNPRSIMEAVTEGFEAGLNV